MMKKRNWIHSLTFDDTYTQLFVDIALAAVISVAFVLITYFTLQATQEAIFVRDCIADLWLPDTCVYSELFWEYN